MKRSRSGDFAGFKTVTVWLPFGYQDFLVKGLSPVICVIDKSYSSSDFIYLGDSSVDFLITKQITLTNIVTSLHLPDGSFARTDPKSAVIYKIVKPNTIPVSIIDSFIKKK